MPLPPENDADLVDVADFARGGLFWLLRERYETSQERGRVFERLMQYAFRRHPDVYGPARFKNVWRWMEWPDRVISERHVSLGLRPTLWVHSRRLDPLARTRLEELGASTEIAAIRSGCPLARRWMPTFPSRGGSRRSCKPSPTATAPTLVGTIPYNHYRYAP